MLWLADGDDEEDMVTLWNFACLSRLLFCSACFDDSSPCWDAPNLSLRPTQLHPTKIKLLECSESISTHIAQAYVFLESCVRIQELLVSA
jgi:hypothetical protein